MTHMCKERENFYRNSTLIVDHTNEAFTGLLHHDLTRQGFTLLQLIQAKQHEIYHLCYNNKPCCMCPTGRATPVFRNINRILNPAQLDILLDTTVKLPGHNHGTKHCCCPANPKINYDQLDLTLTRCLLVNFTAVIPDGSPERLAVDGLIKFRNESYGHATKGLISDYDYQIYKAQIEKFILVLAQAQGRESELKQKLSDAAVRPLDETILRQYQTKLMENVEMIQTLKNIESAVGVKSLPEYITKDLEDSKIVEGCDARLELWTTGSVVDVEWFKGDKKIEMSDKYVVETSCQMHSLVVTNTILTDRGIYTATIIGYTTSARLDIEEYYTKNMKKAIDCIEGDNVELSCAVLEDNVPAVWEKDGVIVRKSRKYKIKDTGKSHTLSIMHLDLGDAGNYSVRINNRMRNTYLQVMEYFTKPLGTMTCIEGETVQFECEVFDDNQTAMWFKDGTEVNTSDRYNVERHGKLHRLVVIKTKLDDKGEYSVKIKNCVRWTTLKVQEYFTQNMNATLECLEGDNVELTCDVLFDDIPAQWKKDGVIVNNCPKYKIKTIGKSHTLSVIQVELQDAGSYSVNVSGRVRSTYLHVTEIPAAINQLSEADKELYLHIIKSGTETRYYIRIVIIGENGVGKTCLLRRLLGEPIEGVESTDGVEIVHKCKIRLSDGSWIFEKGKREEML